jgi:hypothetical protein
MTRSRVASRAAAYAGQASRARVAQAAVAAASAASVGVDAAREAARVNSYTEPTNILTASDAGDGTATIHVAAHKRVYPVQGGLKVPDVNIVAHDILGQPLGAVDRWVSYDDPTLADTTPAFDVRSGVNAPRDAQVGAAPGRHLVGITDTPAAAAPPTSGSGGSTAPGGGGGRILV